MSRLTELIEELCPDGVEFRPLSDLVRIRNGCDYKTLSPGNVPVYGSGGVMTHVSEALGEGPTVLIPRKGSLDNIFFVEGEFWTVDTIFYTEIASDLDPKFFYYKMKTMHLSQMNEAAGVPSMNQRKLGRIQIPVPPLEVQREIVRILDQFTMLEAELEAELTIRRRQHGFYRSELLARESLQKRVGVLEYKTLGDLFETRNGYTPSKRDRTAWDRDDVPWFRMEDIRENGGILDSALISISNSAVKAGRVFPANSILVATSATIGAHALVTVEHLSNQRFTSLQPKESACGLFDPYFLYYYCFLLDEYCLNHANVSSFASVDMRAFRAFEFPILPLDVQREIASILDQFTGLEKELEAEIEARRAQCTYYRDRLLSFPEKVVSRSDAS